MPTHIRIARLESRRWNCTVTTDGVTQNLSGCVILFTVKQKYSYTDGQALFQCNVANGGISFSDTTGGEYVLYISSTATQSVSKSGKNEPYVFDHKIKLSDGTVKVLEEGDFVVTPNVTDTI